MISKLKIASFESSSVRAVSGSPTISAFDWRPRRKPGTPRAPAVRDDREPRHPPRLASASHRAEVRRPSAPRTRTAADDRRDSATGGAYGDGFDALMWCWL